MIYFCKMISTKQALRNWDKWFRKSVGVKGWAALWLLRQSIQLSVAWWVKVTHFPNGMPSKMNYTERREDTETETWSMRLTNGRCLCFSLKPWFCHRQVVRTSGLTCVILASSPVCTLFHSLFINQHGQENLVSYFVCLFLLTRSIN